MAISDQGDCELQHDPKSWKHYRAGICSQSAVNCDEVRSDAILLSERFSFRDLARSAWEKIVG